jgi:hypothetical protein
MIIRRFSAIAALLMLASFNANSGIEKNDKSASIFGSLTSADDSDTLTISAAGGLFYTETLELQGTVLLISSSSSGSDVTVSGYGANANLYLPGTNPDIIPYVGGGGMIIMTDFNGTTDTALGLNIQTGIKQFITEEVSLNYQAQYTTSSDYDAFVLSVGFSIFLD